MKHAALLGALLLACSDDVVARRRPSCASAPCLDVPHACSTHVCTVDLCSDDAPLIAAADSCDGLGSAYHDNALCTCGDVVSASRITIASAGATEARASVGGRISPGQGFRVDGPLYSVAGSDAPELVNAARVITGTGSCRCDASSVFDFSAGLAALPTPAASPAPTLLDGFVGPQTLALGCGVHRLTRVAGSDALTIAVEGHTLLWIDGNVELDDSLRVELADGAFLELVIGGDVRVAGAASLGSPNAALSATVGGSGTINLRGSFTLHGSLVAPRAELVLAGASEVHGGLFVRRLATEADLAIYADAAVVPTPSCASTRRAASSPLFTASGMPTPR